MTKNITHLTDYYAIEDKVTPKVIKYCKVLQFTSGSGYTQLLFADPMK